MTPVPQSPMLYHITHVDNIPSIVEDKQIWSDAKLIDKGGPTAPIGMGSIKQRRLGLPVKCHPGDMVGDYVPFYFCPRSIMLYLIYRANHSELNYKGGQGLILHLEFDMHDVVEWAEEHGHRWAFSLSNAGARYTEFRNSLDDLGELNWAAIPNTDFRNADVKEAKQAEFLVKEAVPWKLVRRIGALTPAIQRQTMRNFGDAAHRPPVEILTQWYY